ncbi:protein of unknown function [Candidatus Methylomirabilis oxygeniifera]|uniref:Uncharacterized protein n=1 Tax=Methylomirabilis oxygeniifera TaxID=671143 RepID=D5MHE1_METO1|nr:protein of unknown function [Candidatus Methylomirabilis oxyfera]
MLSKKRQRSPQTNKRFIIVTARAFVKNNQSTAKSGRIFNHPLRPPQSRCIKENEEKRWS